MKKASVLGRRERRRTQTAMPAVCAVVTVTLQGKTRSPDVVEWKDGAADAFSQTTSALALGPVPIFLIVAVAFGICDSFSNPSLHRLQLQSLMSQLIIINNAAEFSHQLLRAISHECSCFIFRVGRILNFLVCGVNL
jgi:hypothetical protein